MDDLVSTILPPLAPVFLLVFVMFAVKVLLPRLQRRGTAKPKRTSDPYERRETLFTRTEARFLAVLREAVPEYEAFGKVRLEDVVQVRRGVVPSERTSARNRIKSRHLDFVLCEPGTTAIACVLELDDASHASARGRGADAKKNRILAAAGVPFVRVNVAGTYDTAELARRIRRAVAPPAPDAKPRTPNPRPPRSDASRSERPTAETTVAEPAKPGRAQVYGRAGRRTSAQPRTKR